MTRWVPLKHVVTFNDETLPESTPEDTTIRYIEISDVRESEGIINSAELTFGDAPSRARRIIRPGDVLVSTVRTYLRAVAAVGEDYDGAIASTGFAVLRATSLDHRFLKYAVLDRAFMDQVVARSTGVSYPAINASDLVSIKIPAPPIAAQRAIADYLDRETAQIDAFIAKNEELITLLTERRATATFRLVTGLDGTEVPPKSVKADWFRAVPQTWDVAPLYTMAKTFAGGTPKSDSDEYWTDNDDDGVDWIAIGDMRAVQSVQPHSGRRVTAAGLAAAGLTPRSGPLVLFAMYASVGEVAMLRRPAVWNQAILGIRANPSRLNERYLYWTLLALRPKLGIYFRSNTQDNLNAAQVRGLRLPVPPLDEQQAIADQVEEAWASVDDAIATARRGVELARERRAALISAAVTGKIDVGVAV